ncbi:hypothetical protein EM6_1293 [Asticcacaulis excentricus]|uniref:Uncharacterized protein n=1 Tax=Asticcacaulis excentricus TaxID=78587 RepID=A0A3G9G8Q0_9CAUL|nr:hypothetical protein EM6_1293 [Asticcacaulis excentricus]
MASVRWKMNPCGLCYVFRLSGCFSALRTGMQVQEQKDLRMIR